MINNCSYKSINPITSDTPTPLSVYQELHKHLDFPDDTTLNNITEYECVFRSKTKIYRTGYTYDGSTFTTGNLATKLTARHATDNVLPEHWAQPDIDNNTVIVCVTHNVRYQKDYNYDKSKAGTIIQSKCEGHLIPLSLYSSEEIAANSTLLCTQTSINELSTKM